LYFVVSYRGYLPFIIENRFTGTDPAHGLRLGLNDLHPARASVL